MRRDEKSTSDFINELIPKMSGRSGCSSAYPTEEEAMRAKVDKDGSTVVSIKENGSGGEIIGDEEMNEKSSAKETNGNEEIKESCNAKDANGEEVKKNDHEESNDKAARSGDFVSAEVKDTENKSTNETVNGKNNHDTEDGDKEAKHNEQKNKEGKVEEEDKQPAPGGILFGTFFQYMNHNEGESTNGQEVEKSKFEASEDTVSSNPVSQTISESMDTN